jgi:DNA-binding transcriptional regulator YiaG
MKKKYQSELLKVIHQDAAEWHKIGAIDDARMREYDEDCLVPEPTPKTSSPRQTPTPAHALGGRK